MLKSFVWDSMSLRGSGKKISIIRNFEHKIRGRPKSTSCYFGPILTHLPLSHFVTHLGTPSQFLVVHAYIHTYVFTEGFVLVSRGFNRGEFVRGFCLEGFVRGGLCPS